jgi:4-hydroxybenzoate polyprenyltransferase
MGSFLANNGINIIILILSILAAFFIRQFSVIVNDIFDLEIDKISNKDRPLVKGVIKRGEFTDFGLLFLILALVYTILINNNLALFLVLLSLFLVILYSTPPLRLRNTIFSSCFVGIGSSLALFFGYVSQKGIILDSTIFSLGILVFFAVSLGGVIKDFKDYKGDRKNKVKNIYTIFGLTKGKKISLVLIAISFLLPLFLFHQKWYDFLFFIIAALTAALDFQKNENHERVLFYAFLLFLYCFLRLKFGYFL